MHLFHWFACALATPMVASALQHGPTPTAPASTLATYAPSWERIIDTQVGLNTPIDIVVRPGDPRWFVVELVGTVRIWDGQEILATPFLDVSSVISMDGLSGLRGFTFHPQYETNGYVYIWYDFRDINQNTFIGLARLERSASQPDQVDPASFTEIFTAPQENRGHGSSRVEFGPDGMLYAMLGDGGLPMDPACNAQNHLSTMGSMIRIDVDSAFPYAIPPDNPFVGDPLVLDEAWHLGFRHPWRWSFDRATGDLWIGDVGQSAWEEVNLAPAGVGGLNFGWSVKEGTDCFLQSACPPSALPCADPGYTDPIFQYDHGQGCSITGGFVYRGTALPYMYGRYVFSDFCSGTLWSLGLIGTRVTDTRMHTPGMPSLQGGSVDSPVAFAEDHTGELLVIDYAGSEVFRLVPECLARPYCQAEPNSLGLSAQLTSSGLPDISENDFTLHALDLPPQTFGYLFMGPDRARIPLGSGLLCISSTNGFVRFPVFVANAAGRAHLPLDFQQPPFNTGPGQVSHGSRWNFQAWYRDGGSTQGNSNLTSGLTAYFTQ